MERTINKHLVDWKNDSQRKVLLLRGARQIGKTYSIRQLGKQFNYYLEVNFEENREVHSFFSKNLDPKNISEKLAVYYNIPIIPGDSLLFFDEIQACPDALRSLRFFHEKYSQLHVVAAGSLLEFVLSDIPSFGVGRIQPLFMYPMSFKEFLLANNENGLIHILNKAHPGNPLDFAFHSKLIDYYKTYNLIGGMPEIVQSYVNDHNLLHCQNLLNTIITTLKDDFRKYKSRSPVILLNEVFESIAFQSGGKFKYSNVSSGSNQRELKQALQLLIESGIAIPVYHTSANGIPLGAQINLKKFKVILFDIGIHQQLMKLDISKFIVGDDFTTVNKGAMAEVFTGLELLHASSPFRREPLFYWHREARGSNAEIDYVIQKNGQVIPIEVKAGRKGGMQSMHLFLKEKNLKKGVRVSLENFNSFENIDVMPLYAISNLGEKTPLPGF
ncbi:MAG: ATP-binding protein [Spirochaetales bacterium]|nr:ATP-binding protein [Spirochaetales bacterium]